MYDYDDSPFGGWAVFDCRTVMTSLWFPHRWMARLAVHILNLGS